MTAFCAFVAATENKKLPVVHRTSLLLFGQVLLSSGERHGYNKAPADTHLTELPLMRSIASCGRRALSQQALVRPVWKLPSPSKRWTVCWIAQNIRGSLCCRRVQQEQG